MYNKSNKLVEEVKRMWIGLTIFALSIGLFLLADLLREQQRTSYKTTDQLTLIKTNRQR